MQTEQRDRILSTLEQHDRPATIEQLAQWTDLPGDKLKSFMDDLVATDGVQKVGRNHYRYTGAPIPSEGESFKGEVTGSSFKGGVIVRDESGASWRIEPL